MSSFLKSWFKIFVKKNILLWKLLCTTKDTITRWRDNVHLFIKRKILKNSIFVSEDELFMASIFPREIINKTLELFDPKTILDLGCGVGKSLDYFISNGIAVTGVDGSRVAISRANHPEFIIKHNLEKELDLHKKFDLIWSFEFIEHIHPKYLDQVLKTFSNHSDKVVISAAHPFQGGDGHFNEQPASYWMRQFERYGYRFNKDKTEKLQSIKEEFAENMLVFER